MFIFNLRGVDRSVFDNRLATSNEVIMLKVIDPRGRAPCFGCQSWFAESRSACSLQCWAVLMTPVMSIHGPLFTGPMTPYSDLCRAWASTY